MDRLSRDFPWRIAKYHGHICCTRAMVNAHGRVINSKQCLILWQGGPIHHNKSATLHICLIRLRDLVFLRLLDVGRKLLGLLLPPRN